MSAILCNSFLSALCIFFFIWLVMGLHRVSNCFVGKPLYYILIHYTTLRTPKLFQQLYNTADTYETL